MGIARRRRSLSRLSLLVLATLALAGALAPVALASFPYSRNSSPTGYDDLYLNPGQVAGDLGGNEFKFAATPDPANGPQINNNPVELNGVRGAHVVDDNASVSTAFTHTTGRPDVTIAILDSGIKWNDAGAMNDLRKKVRLNKGELPKPANDGGTSLEGTSCASYGPSGSSYDLNGDTVFNVVDYACDNRVDLSDSLRVGPAGVLTPQDIIIAFSDGIDGTSGAPEDNGYVDDIAGWDFLDNDNDPFDDVQYGHGTGEAQDSIAEADNGNDLSSCPNCMGVPLRVGDSFIADVSRFGAAVTYATDNDVQVVQEALGTLNNSSLARQAVDYAYRHGVTVMASAADEAAQHNNWPSTLPHTIVVNSVRDTPLPAPNKSYLAFNGCTNFNAKITLAIPSTSCSSNAVGLAAGYAGLIYSAAKNAADNGKLITYPDTGACRQTNGDPCLITPNEVRQLLASGTVGGQLVSDDVNFAGTPAGSGNEPSCRPAPLPGCTSPYGAGNALRAQVNANRPAYAPGVAESYPARFGHDQFYGYGRANLDRGTSALFDDPANPGPAKVPPEAEIFSPEWFEPLDPARSSIDVEGEVFARGTDYRCQVLVAPGQYPNERTTQQTPPGDFRPLTSGYCDGSTVHSGAAAASLHRGTLASINVAALKAQFPPGTDFTGSQPPASPATGNGRPFFAPDAFTFKVEITTSGPNPLTGEDERSSYLHRDASQLPGFSKAIRAGGQIAGSTPTGDGESSPAFADLDGDNRNELIFGSSDGFVHALRLDGTELPGWPVRGDVPRFISQHAASKAYAGGEVSTDLGGAILSSVAIGDPDGDGVPTVYAADLEGKVYGWSPDGNRAFTEESDPAFSGKPLTPFANVRDGPTNRTQHGFFASPVLADLNGDGSEELIAAGMDRHLYAWKTADSDPNAPGGAEQLPGYPLLVVDPSTVQSVAPQTDAITFKASADSKQQGAIIDTPALANIAGDSRPEIIVGTNEEYTEPINAGNVTTASFGALGPAGILSFGNSRVFALRPDGGTDADPLPGDAILPGWPFSAGIALTELLPVVGEGITGMPAVSSFTCPSGGAGPKIGVQANNGPAYILNADGTSCYGNDPTSGKPNALESDLAAGPVDHPILPAVGHPAFGDLGGAAPTLLAPAAGTTRALDLVLPEYQPTGQDFIAGWDSATGQFRPGFPAAVNDLQFLTGPSIADIDGLPGQEVVEGSASQDLAAFNAAGSAVAGWPKLTTDWTVTNPLIGTFGTLDTTAGARKVVVGMTRSGYIDAYATNAGACGPASWPRFHHDNANSGDSSRDAVLPGVSMNASASDGGNRISFQAPGDDLLCGKADHYELVTSDDPIDAGSFAAAMALSGVPAPADPGTSQSIDLPPSAKRYVAIRAVDEQGNVGRPVSLDVGGPGGGGGGGGGKGRCATRINGDRRNNRLNGSGASERIKGGDGNDRIHGRGGDDCIAANDGNDRASGDGGDDSVRGNDGNDKLKGGGGSDRLGGGRGNDRIAGGGGRDVIAAGPGKDRVNGGGGKDLIKARDRKRDRVHCGGGRDKVIADRSDRVARDCERVKVKGKRKRKGGR